MEKRYLIRRLEASDCKDVITNYYTYFKELKDNPTFGLTLYRKKPSYKSELAWFRSLQKDIKKDAIFVSVAEVNGKVVGLCEVRCERKGSESDHIGTLGIAIIKRYRGIGIGRALMEDIINKSKNKYEMLKLAVFSNNISAERLYIDLGFKRYGLLKNSIKRKGRYFSEDLMCLNLRHLQKKRAR